MQNISTEKETLNSIRGRIQKKCIDLWTQLRYYGYALITMGVGKSKIIADAINLLKSDPGVDLDTYEIPILVLVNSRTLRDAELPAQLKEWGCHHKVKTACYQAAYKWKGKRIGAIFADELDFAISENEKYSRIFTNNSFKYFLGLTGTLIPEKAQLGISIFNSRPFMKYTLADAHRDGILNKVVFCIHDVDLGNEVYEAAPYGDTSRYKWIQKKIGETKRDINNAYAYKRELQKEGYPTEEITEEINRLFNLKAYWEYSPRNKNSRAMMLKTAKSVMDYGKKLKNFLLKDLNNKVIVFSLLKESSGAVAKYTFTGDDKDTQILDLFNDGEVRELGVVKKVNRGVNFKKLNHCIVLSYNSSATDFKQGYIGRMVRLPQDEVAYIHLLLSYYLDREGNKIYCHSLKWLESVLDDPELGHIQRVFY